MRFYYPVKTITVVILACFGLTISVSLLQAQYLGRNKVQYETFDFKVLHL